MPKNAAKFIAFGDSRGIGRKALVVRKFGDSADFAEVPELMVITHCHNNGPIGRLEWLIGCEIGVGVAQTLGRLAGYKPVARLIGEHRNLHIEKRHVDVLSFAGLSCVQQCGEDRVRRIKSRKEVCDRDTDLHGLAAWRFIRLPSDTHQTTHGLDHVVIARAVRQRSILAKTGNRTVDEAWVAFVQ